MSMFWDETINKEQLLSLNRVCAHVCCNVTINIISMLQIKLESV